MDTSFQINSNCQSNIVFSAPYADQVYWTSGNIVTPDGNLYTINAGNTGSMTDVTFIYFDPTIDANNLQVINDSTVMQSTAVLLVLAQSDVTTADFTKYFTLLPFSPNPGTVTQRWIGDGITTAFVLNQLWNTLLVVYDNSLACDPNYVTLAGDGSEIDFTDAPVSGHVILGIGVPPNSTGGGGGGTIVVPSSNSPIQFLNSWSANNSPSLNCVDFYNAKYDQYIFKIIGLCPVSSPCTLYAQFSIDDGITWDGGANYGNLLFMKYIHDGNYNGSGVEPFPGNTAAMMTYHYGNLLWTNIPLTYDGEFTLQIPLLASQYNKFYGHASYYAYDLNVFHFGDYVEVDVISNYLVANSIINGLSFYFLDTATPPNIVNISDGTIRCYGLAKQ